MHQIKLNSSLLIQFEKFIFGTSNFHLRFALMVDPMAEMIYFIFNTRDQNVNNIAKIEL